MIAVMANEVMRRGPTGERVAGNVRQLRKQRQLDLEAVSERLDRLGHPIGINSLSKIERGLRRIDVDDLMALSIALQVTPNRLLLGASADNRETVKLTETDEQVDSAVQVTVATRTAWLWACGEANLPQPPAIAVTPANPTADYPFREENRPHDPPDRTPIAELQQHAGRLAEIGKAVETLREDGLSKQAILGYLELQEMNREFWDQFGNLDEEESDDGER